MLDKHLPTSFPDGTRAEQAVTRKEQLMAQLEELQLVESGLSTCLRTAPHLPPWTV